MNKVYKRHRRGASEQHGRIIRARFTICHLQPEEFSFVLKIHNLKLKFIFTVRVSAGVTRDDVEGTDTAYGRGGQPARSHHDRHAGKSPHHAGDSPAAEDTTKEAQSSATAGRKAESKTTHQNDESTTQAEATTDAKQSYPWNDDGDVETGCGHGDGLQWGERRRGRDREGEQDGDLECLERWRDELPDDPENCGESEFVPTSCNVKALAREL